MVQDPEEIRRLTKSYRHLRGYEQLPLVLLVPAAHFIGTQHLGDLLATLAALAVAIAAMYAIKRYYDHRFGVVVTAGGPGWGIVGIGGFLAFMTLQFLSNGLELRVQLGFLAFGIAAAVYALRRFELEWQKLFVAVFFITISFWPPITDPRGPNPLWHDVFIFGFSAAWIATAIWDHRTLVKTFERARLAPNGAS